MTSQLLIEMPAEGAARLITLSLLEQLMQNGGATTAASFQQEPRQAVAYRASVRRLLAGLSLYDDALHDSVPRKARRRLRALGDAVERFHRADVQLAWCTRHVPGPDDDAPDVLGDGTRAAIWLRYRVTRRHARALRLLQRAQNNIRPLRRIAKRLGVYTTAVRLDAPPTQQSFARITSDQLLAHADQLGASLRTAWVPANLAEFRRAMRAAEYLGYLLEPLRAYADIEGMSAQLRALQAALERINEVALAGRAIVRGGRRVASQSAGESLTAIIWTSGEVVGSGESTNGRAPLSPADLHRGLLVLAESLHDEAVRAFDALTTIWKESGGDAQIERITALAAELAD